MISHLGAESLLHPYYIIRKWGVPITYDVTANDVEMGFCLEKTLNFFKMSQWQRHAMGLQILHSVTLPHLVGI